MKTLTAKQLKQQLSNEDVTVVNVLSEENYRKKHIPGSINIPFNDLEDRAEDDLPDKEAPIIVYCANTSCQASPKAAQKLEEMGYSNVSDFEAGIEGWEEAGYDFKGSDA